MSERTKATLPVEEIRRQNLRAEVERSGSTAQQFAKRLPFKASRLSQLIAPGSTERFTEDTAVSIERALGLVHGSISRAGGAQVRDRKSEGEQNAQIARTISEVVLQTGNLPDDKFVAEISGIVLENAARTGVLDLELLASLAKRELSKKRGK